VRGCNPPPVVLLLRRSRSGEMGILSSSEPAVVADAPRVWSGANGEGASVKLLPTRDKEKVGLAVEFRCEPGVARSVSKGDVVTALIETTVVVFGRTADVRSELRELKAA